MIINNIQFNCDLSQIIEELQSQLALNHIPLMQKIHETPSDIMVQCPYHGNGQEKRPSAGIRKSDGQFHCFACGEVHSLQEVISHCFGHYDDMLGKFGWTWLLKNFATINVEERKDVNLDFSRNTNNTTADMDSQNYVTEEELDKYRYYHPYWKERKITDERLIDLFDLGYDKATRCITFPIRDDKGRTLFVARRSVDTKYFNYPAGVSKPLYGLYEYETVRNKHVDWYCGAIDFREWKDELIVCESMLDALTAWQYGRYAVALNGLGNDLQFKQLRSLPCRKLILATDNDTAGMAARKRIRQNIRNKIITEYILPKGKKDLNDLEKCEFDALEEIF